jgi:hypothetical protein
VKLRLILIPSSLCDRGADAEDLELALVAASGLLGDVSAWVTVKDATGAPSHAIIVRQQCYATAMASGNILLIDVACAG